VIIVTSPLNTAPICDLIVHRAQFVVQPAPLGPGEALLRGLQSAHAPEVLVLMGDNWMEYDDLQRVARQDVSVAVGTMAVGSREVAKRFTRVRWDLNGNLQSEEGDDVTFNVPCSAWCGPLLLPRERTAEVLSEATRSGELKIGPHLGEIARDLPAVSVMVKARDIGVPEEL
jgi:hypothetical protein